MRRTNLAKKKSSRKTARILVFALVGESGGMLPQKVLEIESLILAKNALSALKIRK